MKVRPRKKELQTENGGGNGRERILTRTRYLALPSVAGLAPLIHSVSSPTARKSGEREKRRRRREAFFILFFRPSLPYSDRSSFLAPPLFFSDGGRGAKGGKEDAVIRSFLPPASIPAAPSAVVVVAVGGSDFPRLRLGGRKRRGRGKGWEEGASG